MCPHAMLCGLCKIVQCNAWMRFHHFIQLGVKCTTDKSMCIQVPSSCGPLHEAQLHYTCKNQYSWLQFSRSICTTRGSPNLCYQKTYLWCLYQQQDGETALIFASKREDLRSMELLLKASADPNHMTKVSTAGKQYLLQFLTLDNIWIIFLLLLYHRAKSS